MRRAYVFPLLLLAFGCSDDDLDLNGTWRVQDPGPGVSYVLTLTQVGSVVTGTGTWTNAHVGGGTLLVTGNYHAPSVNLSVKYEKSGRVSALVGVVQDSSHISGTLDTWSLTLVRP
jgi:hypothetical protein